MQPEFVQSVERPYAGPEENETVAIHEAVDTAVRAETSQATAEAVAGFFFFVEKLSSTPPGRDELPRLVLPAGVSRLPDIADIADIGDIGDSCASESSSESCIESSLQNGLESGFTACAHDSGVSFEPIIQGHKPVVIMYAPLNALSPVPARSASRTPHDRVRLNGQRAPRLSVLEIGDQVLWGDVVLHLSRTRVPRVGGVPTALIGCKCGICTVPFDDSSTVVVCDCGAGMHLDPETVPEAERLDCALLGSCPACDQPVPLEAGLVYLPELV
jgi:hypothetical protein